MASAVCQTIEELRNAGAPDFFERNTDMLKAQYKTNFEAQTKRTLYPAQTEMFLIELMAYAHALYNEAAQLAAEQNTVVFAEGSHLANKGADVSTFRLLAQKATTTIRFSLAETRARYIEYVKEVHPDIVDVEPHRPEPGHIHIYALMRDGIVPPEVKAAILDYLDPETRRAMGDYCGCTETCRRD